LPRRTYFWTFPVAVFSSSDTTIETNDEAPAFAKATAWQANDE
jgi:hypothetical protein